MPPSIWGQLPRTWDTPRKKRCISGSRRLSSIRKVAFQSLSKSQDSTRKHSNLKGKKLRIAFFWTNGVLKDRALVAPVGPLALEAPHHYHLSSPHYTDPPIGLLMSSPIYLLILLVTRKVRFFGLCLSWGCVWEGSAHWWPLMITK